MEPLTPDFLRGYNHKRAKMSANSFLRQMVTFYGLVVNARDNKK